MLIGDEVPFNRERQSGVPPPKKMIFATIGSYSVTMVADRPIGTELMHATSYKH